MHSPPDRSRTFAPGWPGIPARWTSSAKSGVGTALGAGSRVWFTISHGILNEIYYPSVDISVHARPRTDRHRWRVVLFRGEARCAVGGLAARAGRSRVSSDRTARSTADIRSKRTCWPIQPPTSSCSASNSIRWTRRAISASVRAARAASEQSRRREHRVGRRIQRRADAVRGTRRAGARARLRPLPWAARSVGFVGHSDGWQQLRADGRLVEVYERAENGNVAATGEIDASRGWRRVRACARLRHDVGGSRPARDLQPHGWIRGGARRVRRPLAAMASIAKNRAAADA